MALFALGLQSVALALSLVMVQLYCPQGIAKMCLMTVGILVVGTGIASLVQFAYEDVQAWRQRRAWKKES